MPVREAPLATHPLLKQQYRRCGKAHCQICRSGGPGHGPYWYAYWRQNGRMRSRYIGKQLPAPMPDPSQPPLRVRTLGAFQVWRGEEAIGAQAWRRPRVLRLFQALLSAPNQRLNREQLAERLWPDRDRRAQLNNLNVTLHELRAVLDPRDADASYVRYQDGVLALAPVPTAASGEHWLDAVAFERAATEALKRGLAECQSALALYQGDYLVDWLYDDTIAARRNGLRGLHVQLLERVATLCSTEGRQEEAVESLQWLLALDPCDEHAAEALMRLHATHGRRTHALQVYRQLALTLKRDLDTTPSRPIERLRVTLLATGAAHAAGTTVARCAPSNLPASLTSFVGRIKEQTVVRRHLKATRLLTLTGEGGSGKTRLAIEAARGMASGFPGGVWLVELAHLPESADLPQAVATALGLREVPGRPLQLAITEFLRVKASLLVLDNCEHLLPACIKLATGLLTACPELRILATSRERLGILGETAWHVPTLSTPPCPDAGERATGVDVETARRYEAVQLFIERAVTSNPDFLLTAVNAQDVMSICRTLDGLPLAIELAASRLAAMPVASLAAALDDRFRTLSDGNRGALPRQQTLWASMEWSYDLLSSAERTLWQRAAVFRGGWTEDAAVAVCAGKGIVAGRIGPLLGALAAKSIVQADTRAGASRYYMLETIRQYGLSRLQHG